MSYQLTYMKGGRVYTSGTRAETPQEAGDDAASYLKDGATAVEIHLVGVATVAEDPRGALSEPLPTRPDPRLRRPAS